MITEEKDIQIEDTVDFSHEDVNTPEDLTPEVSDFDESPEATVEPEANADFSAEPGLGTSSEIQIETPKETQPTQNHQPQETSSPGRVMRFEDFVSRD